MISLACAIIMLHAVVPHHHHDCSEAKGFVFETEVACHCECDYHECDHRHSHHPFNTCWLEEMLSHLVISTYDETNYVAYIQAEAHNSFILTVPPVMDDMCTPAVTGGTDVVEPKCCPACRSTRYGCPFIASPSLSFVRRTNVSSLLYAAVRESVSPHNGCFIFVKGLIPILSFLI